MEVLRFLPTWRPRLRSACAAPMNSSVCNSAWRGKCYGRMLGDVVTGVLAAAGFFGHTAANPLDDGLGDCSGPQLGILPLAESGRAALQ